MIFADTHTHLYLDEFNDDRGEMIRRALDSGVRFLFLPNIDSSSVDAMLSLASKYPENCFPMAGLHPSSVKDGFREELASVEKMLKEDPGRYYAIGEVGMDLYWDTTFRSEQEEALQVQMDLAIQYDLPLVIHTRNSMDISLDLIASRNDPRLRGIFHCFGGNVAQARRVIGLGFFLGIGGVITFKNSGLQKVVESVPPDHIVLETDSPFLAPMPFRGKRNESAYIPLIAAKVAEIQKVPVETVAGVTTDNALKLFNLRG